MSLESSLFSLLSPLSGGRVFPDVAPLSTARPYITWQQVGGESLAYTDDTVPDLRNGLIQINVWHDTRAGATALALQIEAALMTANDLQSRPDGALIATHEPDLSLYGTRQDFSIWATR